MALDSVRIITRDLDSANRASLLLRKFSDKFVAKLVCFNVTIHEPGSVQADKMEPMVAVVDAAEIRSFRKLGLVCLLVSLTELLKTYVAPSTQVVVVTRHQFLNCSVQIVDDLFIFFKLFVAMFLQALLNVFLDLKKLVVIKTL